jgi:hypothetical protein
MNAGLPRLCSDDDGNIDDEEAPFEGIGHAGVDALLAMLSRNFVLPEIPGLASDELAELRCHYRVPHVRHIVRTRVMCQAGRARASGAHGDTAAWLCERAPLWVVVHVCALLRDTPEDE